MTATSEMIEKRERESERHREKVRGKDRERERKENYVAPTLSFMCPGHSSLFANSELISLLTNHQGLRDGAARERMMAVILTALLSILSLSLNSLVFDLLILHVPFLHQPIL